MMVINAAYKVLRDKDLRASYDQRRAQGYFGAKAGVKEKSQGSVKTYLLVLIGTDS